VEPTLRKNREERDTRGFIQPKEKAGKAAHPPIVLTVQGFTQKHPNWLHLKTSPGMQVITERLVEIRELLLCSVSAFNVMIGVHSSAVTMMSLPRFIIFIKVLLDFWTRGLRAKGASWPTHPFSWITVLWAA
jgi:hypothetical protein